MKASTIIVFSTVLAAFGFLAASCALMLHTPFLEYSPTAGNAPTSLQGEYSPVALVEEFLRGYDSLPPPGTPIKCCTPTLEWDIETPFDPPFDNASQQQIRDLIVNKVVVSTNKSLLGNLFDDDPTHFAHVYLDIRTINGQQHQVVIKLWNYGLLTPWAITSSGEGWKPHEILW